MSTPTRTLKLTPQKDHDQKTLPGILQTTTRSGSATLDPLLEGVTVAAEYRLASASRSADAAPPRALDGGDRQLLALESEGGGTLFIHADQLAAEIARLQPEAVGEDGAVDLNRFRGPAATSRGVADVLWKAVRVLTLPEDALVEEAAELARQWAREKLGEAAQDAAIDAASCLGAKAVMWKIESQLAGEPGLYQWKDKTMSPGDRCPAGDARLAPLSEQPGLVFIHGTASYTLGSFNDLRLDDATWEALRTTFPGGIFGFEHRTFSESPVENALALARTLPEGARITVVTHSRGGLVGDLMCLGRVGDAAINAYHVNPEGLADEAGVLRAAEEERQRLRALRDTLKARRITVDRYLRVACPARGTTILSDNLDAALSDLLNLMQMGGSALFGLAVGAVGGPVAGKLGSKGASSCLGVLKRLVLEIAQRRLDPRVIPGIFAMRPDSPLARFLAHPEVERATQIQMAVIAGDLEFDGLGLSRLGSRLANLFCDWRLFERNDNDLVVDSDSMFAGLASRKGARYLFDQDASVDHFHYFSNTPTREALRQWLTRPGFELDKINDFLPLGEGGRKSWSERFPSAARGAGDADRPVVILLPGILGTHLKAPEKLGPDRIWLHAGNLAGGHFTDLTDLTSGKVVADDLLTHIYGDLAEYLGQTHQVIRFPYDWRQRLEVLADALQAAIADAAQSAPGQPIRLVAHSMGGLVVRALMRKHPRAWQTVVESGGRLLMLGTPNQGAHLTVHHLLGKSAATRMLASLDLRNDLQAIAQAVASLPGALGLLPRPGLAGADDGHDYYQAATWDQLKAANRDRWFGNAIGAQPAQTMLDQARADWEALHAAPLSNPERISYVCGQAAKTPCGLQRAADGEPRLLFTREGDGTVTWASARLPELEAAQAYWLMPVEHADLPGAPEHFAALQELLETGRTVKLERLPASRGSGAAAAPFTLEAPPPVLPADEELARAALGSSPRRRRTASRVQPLKVAVHAGDVNFVDQPVLCGHSIGDPISGPEAALDRILEGALTERERLGLYASEVGTSAIVLRQPNELERARGSLRGAVIVGLGKYTGQLSTQQITETVRGGVLRYLLQRRDTLGLPPDHPVQLYSVLIGSAGAATGISVAESVVAVTRGVLQANQQFMTALGKGEGHGQPVASLNFIEMFRDTAISAAYTVRALGKTLQDELKRLGARVDAASELSFGPGVRHRLSNSDNTDYWTRLIVTDPDGESGAADVRPAPPPGSGDAVDASAAEHRYHPQRLKYVFLSPRARAESVAQVRQPGLIETIIQGQRSNPANNPRLGQLLFQLMVPLEFKAAAREQAKLMLVLDQYTANLPWELLEVEGGPLVLQTPMVRQLATQRYRARVSNAGRETACLIVSPSTVGFNTRFPTGPARLAQLPKAVDEGTAVENTLRENGWGPADIKVCPEESSALDVLTALYEQPYRILLIAGHGVFEAKAKDGRRYSGVVLSDGLLLTAVEIAQMEVVPEVVLLSCCHLGSVSTDSNPDRLAYSLAQELIEMGVRCVVAAAWAVDDAAACTFSRTLFRELAEGENFGKAVFCARRATYQAHPGCNTWGAYQAYGDPSYRLRPQAAKAHARQKPAFVAVEELLASLERIALRLRTANPDAGAPPLKRLRQELQQELDRCPPEWSESPEVLQALGRIYSELGEDGFEEARRCYLTALQTDDAGGRVAVRTIEQLANLEVRLAEALAARGELAQAEKLADFAIVRLHGLKATVDGGDAISRANTERAVLLGSANKHRAAISACSPGADWNTVSKLLGEAALAYGAAVAGPAQSSPNNTLNRLQLEALATPPADPATAIALAKECGQEANRRFAASRSFWDAVGAADAVLTAWLLGEALVRPAHTLLKRYQDATASVPGSARQWNSVLKQWRLLAGFLRLRARNGDDTTAAELEKLMRLHGGGEEPAAEVVERVAPAGANTPPPRKGRKG